MSGADTTTRGGVGMQNRWFRSGLIAAVVVLAAFCFLRYLDWAFSYSATLGLSSRMQQARLANQRAWVFFCLFLVLEAFSAILVGFSWQEPDFSSAWLRFSARYGLALLLSLLATGIIVGLWLASGRFI